MRTASSQTPVTLSLQAPPRGELSVQWEEGAGGETSDPGPQNGAPHQCACPSLGPSCSCPLGVPAPGCLAHWVIHTESLGEALLCQGLGIGSSHTSPTPRSWCPAHCPGEETGSGANCLWEEHSGSKGPSRSRLGGPFLWCHSPGSCEPANGEAACHHPPTPPPAPGPGRTEGSAERDDP